MQIVTEHGKTIEFNKEKHVYIHNNQYIVGMSTILSKLASPMLENWKIANQVNAIKKEMERHGIPIDKIESILEGKADSDVSSYSIGNRSLSKMTPEELTTWRDYYKAEYNKEVAKERIDRKEGTGNIIKVRFDRVG